MDEIREEFIAAEECLIEVLESYMAACTQILQYPDMAQSVARLAKMSWSSLLTELKAKHAQHTATVKDGE